MLPRHGWRVVECCPSGRRNSAGHEHRSKSRVALAARRAQADGSRRPRARPVCARVLRVQPEALAPNNAWAVTGRRLVRSAIERERPTSSWRRLLRRARCWPPRRWSTSVPLIAGAARPVGRQSLLRPRQSDPLEAARSRAGTRRGGRHGHRRLPHQPASTASGGRTTSAGLAQRLRPRAARTPLGARTADAEAGVAHPRGRALRRPNCGGARCGTGTPRAPWTNASRAGRRDRPAHSPGAPGQRRPGGEGRATRRLGRGDQPNARRRRRGRHQRAQHRRRHGAADEAVRGARTRPPGARPDTRREATLRVCSSASARRLDWLRPTTRPRSPRRSSACSRPRRRPLPLRRSRSSTSTESPRATQSCSTR